VAVEVDRGIDRFENRVGLLLEPAAPHALVHGFRSRRTDDPMTATPPQLPSGPAGRAQTLRIVLAAALVGAGVGFAAVYGIGGLSRNGSGPAADAACKDATETVKKLAPLARGEVAAFAVADRPRALPELSFADKDGKALQLA